MINGLSDKNSVRFFIFQHIIDFARQKMESGIKQNILQLAKILYTILSDLISVITFMAAVSILMRIAALKGNVTGYIPSCITLAILLLILAGKFIYRFICRKKQQSLINKINFSLDFLLIMMLTGLIYTLSLWQVTL